MRKLGWFAVSAVVAALVVSGVLLLAANLYVQSQGVQQRIRQTVAEALHLPISLKKTTVTPWEGLRLDGIVFQAASPADGNPEDPRDFMTVESFRVRIAWWPLVTERRVAVEAILLDHPRLAWAQNAEGRWVWPEDPALKHPRGTDETSPEPAQQPAELPPPASARLAPPTPPTFPLGSGRLVTTRDHTAPTLQGGAPEIPGFRVRHGWLDLLNQHHKLLGHLEELDMDGRLHSDGHAEGELRFQRATLARPALRLTNFRSAFAFDEAEGLSIDNGQGDFAGGELRTNYRLSTQLPGSPFSAECRVNNVELSELLQEAGSQLHLMEGRLQGEMHLEGASDDPARRHATGQLRLVGAEVRNFPVLQLLGEMLRIKDLSHLQFKTAELDCQLDGDDLRIAPLDLVSNDLQVLAQGRYTAGTDQLDLHGKLIIDSAIGHQLPQFIEMNFSPCGEDAPGCRYIDFQVTGPLSKPTTDLFDRVLAGPSSGLLQNLLAPKPRKPRIKHPKTAGPTPAAVENSGGS